MDQEILEHGAIRQDGQQFALKLSFKPIKLQLIKEYTTLSRDWNLLHARD